MSAIGPTPINYEEVKLKPLTRWTQPVTLGATDTAMTTLFNAGFCIRVVAQATGTVSVQRFGDAGFTPYAVVAGTVIEGYIIALGSTAHGSTAIAVVCEL